ETSSVIISQIKVLGATERGWVKNSLGTGLVDKRTTGPNYQL
ncbi:hypothetical protein FOWG_18098, partial [Fusarium oxysporum f. sp. lycopersici MN25]